MRAIEVPAWVVGAALASLVSLALWVDFPGVRTAESKAIDLLFLHGQIDPPRPSPNIVLALVDDQAIETIGRWPWPRAKLADTIGLIEEFGARVIAVDILLTEPSQFGDDGELERVFALRRSRVLLATDPKSVEGNLGPTWQGTEGRAAWRALLSAIGRDITATATALIDELHFEGTRAIRVHEKLAAYKRIVVRSRAQELRSRGVLSYATLKKALVPEALREIGNFPERRFLEMEIERAQSAGLLERSLPQAQSGVPYATADGVVPPLPRFARHVFGPGIVKAEADPDGVLRRVTLRWNIGGRIYPQLGAAAAAAYEPAAKRDEDESMLLSWPGVDVNRGANVFETCSVGVVANLAARERRLAEREELKKTVSARIRTEFLPDIDPGQFETQHLLDAEIRNEVEFQLADVEGDGDSNGDSDQEAEDEQARVKIREFRNWLRLDTEIQARKDALAADRARLRLIFQDRLVFLGWSASGNFGDFFPTAIAKRTPGVVAHAIVANSILEDYVVRELPAWVGALVAILLGLISTLVTRRAGPRFSFLFATLLVALYLAFDIVMVFNEWNHALATVTPVVSVYVAWAGSTTVRAVRERRERAQLQRQFGARISPQLFDYLVSNPELVHLEGQEREVTCFFSDLAGFTSLSESLDSVATVKLLNRYMYEMNAELTKHSAYVNKFLGDGVMAVWGAFAVETPHAELACRAAIGCRERLAIVNALPELSEFPELTMRIGIATGVVTVGDCGAPPDLRDYTVIGNSANLAARLESANKQFGTNALINGRTKELLSDEILTRPLGVVTVVGQKTPTEIHEVLALTADATDEQRAIVDLTTRAIEAFRNQSFDGAVKLFRELRSDPESATIAELYLAQVATHQGGDENVDFDGVLHLTKK